MMVVIQTGGKAVDVSHCDHNVYFKGEDRLLGALRDLLVDKDLAGYHVKAKFIVTVPMYLDEDHGVKGHLESVIEGNALRRVVFVPDGPLYEGS